jgi:CRISPR-associated protein Csx16
MAKKYFVTRHPGAVTWAAEGGARARKVEMNNFDPATVQRGDVVMGTLPVHLAAEVNARGGHYWHLSLDTPVQWRGKELNAAQMREFNARLEEFRVQALGVRLSSDPEVAASPAESARVHLCIATGQTLPNLLPLRALPWSRVVVFASADMLGSARRLQRLVEAMGPRADGQPARCEIVAMPARLDWASLRDFAAREAGRLAGEGPLDFNVTGGQKLMALAFAEAFRSRARLLYCSTDNGMLDVIDTVQQDSLPLAADLLDVDAYLGAQGFTVTRKLQARGREEFLPVRRRESLTASLVLGAGRLLAAKWSGEVQLAETAGGLAQAPRWSTHAKSLLGLLHELGSEARELKWKNGSIKRRFCGHVRLHGAGQDEVWTATLEALRARGIIGALKVQAGGPGKGSVSFAIRHDAAAAYLAGGYLEEYALLSLASLDLPISHFASGVGIGLVDKASAQVSRELNEIDAVAVWRNRLLAIECKAGVDLSTGRDQDIIHKLDQLKDNVGGAHGQAWLVTQRKLSATEHADVLQRAAMNGIELLHGPDAMKGLGARLARTLACKVKEPWPDAAMCVPALLAKAKT